MLIVGNWKMNGGRAALGQLGAIAAAASRANSLDVAICPPATLIEQATAYAPPLLIGAQDCHAFESGPHTGRLAPSMLYEAGARLVIVGHSECRKAHGESDADVRAKAQAAIAAGLTAIVCVGEPIDVRMEDGAEAYVEKQLRASVPTPCAQALIVAYEPIWAIGTGLVPDRRDVAAMHAMIRRVLIVLMGYEQGSSIRILYGGSVNGQTAASLLAIGDVDGVLVGGASLTAQAFVPIIQSAGPLLKSDERE